MTCTDCKALRSVLSRTAKQGGCHADHLQCVSTTCSAAGVAAAAECRERVLASRQHVQLHVHTAHAADCVHQWVWPGLEHLPEVRALQGPSAVSMWLHTCVRCWLFATKRSAAPHAHAVFVLMHIAICMQLLLVYDCCWLWLSRCSWVASRDGKAPPLLQATR
jgi:hypothetical protein